jgi:hypothetical protein
MNEWQMQESVVHFVAQCIDHFIVNFNRFAKIL